MFNHLKWNKSWLTIAKLSSNSLAPHKVRKYDFDPISQKESADDLEDLYQINNFDFVFHQVNHRRISLYYHQLVKMLFQVAYVYDQADFRLILMEYLAHGDIDLHFHLILIIPM